MKNLILIFFAITVMATSCGTMKFATQEVQNPIKEAYRNDTNTKYRAVGMGESYDAQVSADISRTVAYGIIAEKLNTEVDGATTHKHIQNDTYTETEKTTETAKSYRRDFTESTNAVLENSVTQLQQVTLFNKDNQKFYVWTAVEAPKRDKKKLLEKID